MRKSKYTQPIEHTHFTSTFPSLART
jgi:hypothetical protein